MGLGCYAAWSIGRAVWWSFETEWYGVCKGFESKWPASLLLISTMRFVGWNFAPLFNEFVTSRSAFLKARAQEVVIGYLLMDIADTLLKDPRFNPGLSSGGGLADSQHGLLNHATGPVLTLLTGTLIYATVIAQHSPTALLSVLLFPDTQPHWSLPVLASPFKADSVRDFWSHRWHQLYRVPFLALGHRPISCLAHRLRLPQALHDALTTLGVFAISALYHEAGSEGMRTTGGEGFFGHGGAVAQFFLLQGEGCILEQLWLRSTGRRVAGWTGRVWTYAWLLGTGMRITDVWNRHGYIRGVSSWRLAQPLVDRFAMLLQH